MNPYFRKCHPPRNVDRGPVALTALLEPVLSQPIDIGRHAFLRRHVAVVINQNMFPTTSQQLSNTKQWNIDDYCLLQQILSFPATYQGPNDCTPRTTQGHKPAYLATTTPL